MKRYPSLVLQRLAANHPYVESYEFEPENEEFGCHWLHLKEGYLSTLDTHSIHECTVRECLDELSQVRKEGESNA